MTDNTSTKAPTLADIAVAAGVSIPAVSKALNEREGVSGATREHVLRIAQGLGYRKRNARATAQMPGRLRLITFDRFVSSDRFYDAIVRSVKDEAAQVGLSIELQLLQGAEDAADAAQALLQAERPQALALIGVDMPELLDAVALIGCPAVIINGMDKQMRVASVSPDYHSGGWLAARHLIDAGHRDIVHVTHPHRISLQQRLAGFRDALEEAGVLFDPAQHVIDISSKQLLSTEAQHVMERYLARGKPSCTGFVCASDMIALGVLQALTAAGYRVPQDFSLIGFDDLAVSTLSSPALTTMAVAREQLGKIAVRLLLEQLGNTGQPIRRISTGVRLVKRDSVRRPNNSNP
jgi:DNA-binding LacI/PurR family transcriptional regulator